MTFNFQHLPHEGIQTLKPYVPGKSIEELAREEGLVDIIKLASNENPRGCSPKVKQALAALSQRQIASYPSPYNHPLHKKLSRYLEIEENWLTLSNGSDFLFSVILITFALATGKQMLTHEYAFLSFEIQAKTLGIATEKTKLKLNWQVDVDALIGAAQKNTAVIFLANPNNPTSSFIGATDIKKILTEVPLTTMIVLDEAYYEYGFADNNSLQLLTQHPNLIITRTFSKAYGLAGLRLGYAIAKPEITELLRRVQLPFTVNQAALEAAFAALEDQAFIQETVRVNQQGKEQLQEGLAALKLTYLPSECNFITFDCGKNALALYHKLLKQGIIVRPLDAYGMPNYLRVTIGNSLQNERFLDKLALCLL